MYQLAAAGVAAIPEIYKFIQARKDRKLANELASAKRPNLNVPIPQAILENVRLAKNRAGVVGIPGQGVLENKIGANTASATRNLVETGQSGASTAAGIAALDQQANDATVNVGIESAKMNLSDLANYMAQNNTLAGYEDAKFNKEWDWNERDPYLQKMAAASTLRNSSEQNTFSGLSNLSSLAAATIYGSGQGKGKSAHDKVNGYTPPPANYPATTNPTGGPITDATGLGTVDNSAMIQQLAAQYGLTPEQIQQLLASQQPH